MSLVFEQLDPGVKAGSSVKFTFSGFSCLMTADKEDFAVRRALVAV